MPCVASYLLPKLSNSVSPPAELEVYLKANYRIIDIAGHMVDAYVDHRLGIDEAANANVQYEIAVFKRMYRLAGKIIGGYKPEFPNIRVNNTRKGFFEESEFGALLETLPDWVKPPIEIAYLPGWRLRSEVIPLQWNQIDFESGEVRLEPGTTKNDEGRIFPFAVLLDLEAMILKQRADTEFSTRERLVTNRALIFALAIALLSVLKRINVSYFREPDPETDGCNKQCPFVWLCAKCPGSPRE
jgi:integrase